VGGRGVRGKGRRSEACKGWSARWGADVLTSTQSRPAAGSGAVTPHLRGGGAHAVRLAESGGRGTGGVRLAEGGLISGVQK
jgi:hypothetical protein